RYRLPPERRLLARATDAGPVRLERAVLRPPRRRRPAGRARPRRDDLRQARGLGRATRPAPRARPRRTRSRAARCEDRRCGSRARRARGLAGGARPALPRAGDRCVTPITQGPITLGEGNTPLLAAPRLGERFGVDLWLKWEGANPTGSFKDRGMAVASTRALERGITRRV